MSESAQIKAGLYALIDQDFQKIQTSFFKTEPGAYSADDIFIGVRAPAIRRFARQHRGLAAGTLQELATGPIHEHRMFALVVLVDQFERAAGVERRELFERYLSWYDLGAVNNWDLVDISAPRFGVQLLNDAKAGELLERLADDPRLWHQRAAVVLSFAFIRANRFDHTLALAKKLIAHEHDLIHKANGWMLREVGKRDLEVLRGFLTEHSGSMPRVMLRYAIEKMDAAERKRWLAR